MESVFHPGERRVQERAGVRDQAHKIGTGIHGTISTAAAEFLLAQSFAVLAAVDLVGKVWASPLAGPRGFLEAVDERWLRVHALPVAGDPLEGFADGADVGVSGDGDAAREAGGAQRASALDDRQQDWIRRADTFFIATRDAEAGADASHRGGNPGFVHVVDGRRLAWPDYSGNRMFQTLGNLESDPRAGVLFPDFVRGRTLQLTGRATVDWDPARANGFAGAERVVDFAIDDVIEIRGRGGLQFRLIGRSPFNP